MKRFHQCLHYSSGEAMKPQRQRFLLLLLFTALFVQPHASVSAGEPAPVRASAAQIARAQASEPFASALKILEEQDETVNLKTVRVVPAPKNAGTIALHFDITRKGSSKFGEYKRLVYVEREGKPPVVYFQEISGIRPIGVSFCGGDKGWETTMQVCGLPVCSAVQCARYNVQQRTCTVVGIPRTRRTEIRKVLIATCYTCPESECDNDFP
jgi:hypothetical protein